jgi:hypothetical protein
MRYPALLLVVAVLAALAIAGCGGGGSDSTETTQATTTEEPAKLSKADFIEQGDAICAEVNSAVGAVGTTESAVQSQTTQVSDLYTGMVESLKRLGAPAEMDGYSEFMEAAEELAKVEGEVKLAAEREDTAALGEAATRATPALEEFETQASVYGFEECGEGPKAPTAAGTGTTGTESGGEEVAPEGSPEAIEEEVPEVEEVAPETGGATEEVAPEGGGTGAGTGGGETGGSSGGIGPG